MYTHIYCTYTHTLTHSYQALLCSQSLSPPFVLHHVFKQLHGSHHRLILEREREEDESEQNDEINYQALYPWIEHLLYIVITADVHEYIYTCNKTIYVHALHDESVCYIIKPI